MKLPHAERAQIEERKIRDYLLSPAHPLGRFKAAFFQTLGYNQENWERLVQDVKEQNLVLDVTEVEATAFGRKYSIEGPLVGPNGRRALVVSVRIVKGGEEVPRFVTAYPA